MATMKRQGSGGVPGLLERRGAETAEVAWELALTWLERAAARGRDGRHGRWRHWPIGELRTLRYEVARAMELARFAVTLQEYENVGLRDLTRELQAAAADKLEAGHRSAVARENARIGHVRRRARKLGREPTFEELYPMFVRGGERPQDGP
jgi:hypothetical protein